MFTTSIEVEEHKQHPQPVEVHQSKTQEVFNSKKELYRFLFSDGKVYLPAIVDNVST